MIYVVATRAHAYTHREPALWEEMPPLQIVPYCQLFRDASLPRGTWIFTDMDRLGFWELELASFFYREALKAGMRILNDPAAACQRFALLRRLYNAGINRFNVWRVENGEMPERYPVFLRTLSAHRGALSELLHNPDEVNRAIEEALTDGYPLRELMLSEFCAEPVREGVYRKLGILRIGDRMISTLSAHQQSWIAKGGQSGIAGQELYDEEYEIVTGNRFAESLRPVFNIGKIEYGRADFSLIDNEPQVYEINTNPTIRSLKEHPFPIRMEADRAVTQATIEAYNAIDTSPEGEPVAVDIAGFMEKRGLKGATNPYEWVP